MKLRCWAPSLLASLALAIPLLAARAQLTPFVSVSPTPSQIVVTLRPTLDNAATLSRIAGKCGRLFVRVPERHTYRFLLNNSASAGTSLALLRSDKAVASAYLYRRNSGAVSSSLTSVKDIRTAMDRLEAASDREEERERTEAVAQRGQTLTAPRREKESGKDALGAYKYWFEMRAFPFGKIPANAYQKAAQVRTKLKPAPLSRFRRPKPNQIGVQSIAGAWEFTGPTNFAPAGSNRTYNYSGRANAVAYDPNNPGTYYLGAAGGGLWVTQDSGATWVPLGDTWQFMQVSSVAVDPTDSQTIYAGTGDYDGFGIYSFGLQKSTDGGLTWTTLGGNLFGQSAISQIVVDPDTPTKLTIATGRGMAGDGMLWHSEDGGLTWNNVAGVGGSWKGLQLGVVGPKGRRYMFAVSENGDLARSTDRGKTWAFLASPAAAGTANLAMSAIDFATLYVVSFPDRIIYKSIDSGQTWNDVSGTMTDSANQGRWVQGWYDMPILATAGIDQFGLPEDINFLGLVGLWYTQSELTDWLGAGGVWHVDFHALQANPLDQSEILLGNDGGAYILNYDRKRNTFTGTSLNRNLGITQFYKGAWHPTDGTIMIGGTQDNGTAVATGNLDQWDEQIGGDGGGVAINPDKPVIQYGTVYNAQVFRTGNMWQSYTVITPNTTGENEPFVTVIKMDPNDSNILYMGTNFLWQWNDKTSTWTKHIGNKNLAPNGVITAIELFYGHNDRIYVGTSDGLVWLTTEFRTFTLLNGPSSGLPLRSIGAINANPNDRDDILVGLSGFGSSHLWRCADTRDITPTFVDVSGTGADALPDVPINAVARDPWNPETTWYVATDVGVFMTDDGGATWTNATNPLGLPNVQVNDIQAVKGNAFLNVATYGRGMWRIGMLPDSGVIDTLTLSPTTCCDGTSSTATVKLKYPAPTGGAQIDITTSDPVNTGVPPNITIPEGEMVGTFPVTTQPVLTKKTATISVSSAGSGTSASAVLTLVPLVPASISVTPSPAVAGFPATGTVTLNFTSQTGATVALSSSDTTVATVPATVNVAAGQGQATFPITVPDTAVNKSAVISATLNGTKVTYTLNVVGILDSVTVSPVTLLGGSQAVLGTVNLRIPAPAPGVTVTLTSSSSTVASVPASVLVSTGANSKAFVITTTKPASDTAVTITATSHGVSRTASLFVVSAIRTTLAFTPNPVQGGSNTTGTVTLNAPAPPGGIFVSLSSDNNAVLKVPVNVAIPAGVTQRNFTANTVAVGQPVVVNVKASYGGLFSTAAVTVLPNNYPSGSSFSPNPACANSFTIGTVTLNSVAPAGGATIAMTSSNTSVATVPATVTVPAGQISGTYTVTTKDVPSDTQVTITASFGGVSKASSLTVKATVLTSVAITPAYAKGGTNVILSINLSCPAPAGGAVVTITSDNPAVLNPPTSVTIPAGKTAANFTLPTRSVAKATFATVSASYHGTRQSATVTVVP